MKPDVSTNVYGRLDRIEENGRETREAVVELRAVMLGANGEGGHLQHQRDMNKLLMAATKQNAGGVERNRRGIARLWGIGGVCEYPLPPKAAPAIGQAGAASRRGYRHFQKPTAENRHVRYNCVMM